MQDVKILKVEKKGKNFLVYTSEDELPIKFTEDAIVNNRIIKDAIFDNETWDRIKKDKESSNLFDKVLSYIDFKPRTEQEVRKYLEKKEANEQVVESIIERLKKIRYIDDTKYALAYIEEGIKNEKGPYLIVYQLESQGISRSIINTNLIRYTYDMQLENASKVARKYQLLQSKYPVKKQKELIYQKLIRSGFQPELINRVINDLPFQEDSLENLKESYLKLLAKCIDKNKIITSLMAKGYRFEDIKKVINDN